MDFGEKSGCEEMFFSTFKEYKGPYYFDYEGGLILIDTVLVSSDWKNWQIHFIRESLLQLMRFLFFI